LKIITVDIATLIKQGKSVFNRLAKNGQSRAKSRRRKGTLHEKGELPGFDEVKLDIFSLYNQAMEQNPNDKPFGVFIDINLPRYKSQSKSWKDLMMEKIYSEGVSVFGSVAPSFLAIINCAWHYDGSNTATNEEFLLLFPNVMFPETQIVKFPVKHQIAHQNIVRAMNLFSKLPEDKLK